MATPKQGIPYILANKPTHLEGWKMNILNIKLPEKMAIITCL